jgi:hypothetical protein
LGGGAAWLSIDQSGPQLLLLFRGALLRLAIEDAGGFFAERVQELLSLILRDVCVCDFERGGIHDLPTSGSVLLVARARASACAEKTRAGTMSQAAAPAWRRSIHPTFAGRN